MKAYEQSDILTNFWNVTAAIQRNNILKSTGKTFSSFAFFFSFVPSLVKICSINDNRIPITWGLSMVGEINNIIITYWCNYTSICIYNNILLSYLGRVYRHFSINWNSFSIVFLFDYIQWYAIFKKYTYSYSLYLLTYALRLHQYY